MRAVGPTGGQVDQVTRWRSRDEPLELVIARAEAVRLAKRVTSLDEEIAANTATLKTLVTQSRAAGLLDKTGIGPVTAAIALTAWSTPAGSAQRLPSRAWPASTPSPPRQGTPCASGSTAAATDA